MKKYMLLLVGMLMLSTLSFGQQITGVGAVWYGNLVHWNPVTPLPDNYNIYRNETSCAAIVHGQPYTTTNKNAHVWYDFDAKNSTTYYYAVSATVGGVEQPLSACVTLTTPAGD